MTRIFTGEEKLKKQSEIGFPKGVSKICDNVYFALGYGGSTCILVVGETSCLLIDTLNSADVANEALVEFRKITDKPIKNIIFTHYQHFDHTSGAGAFADENTRIIGRKPTYPTLGNSKLLADIYGKRGAKQFGPALPAEEAISVGIGPRNNMHAKKAILPCNYLINDDIVEMDFEGIKATLVAAPGETDDQIFIYLPQYKVLCCGDNYYESFPNLYAIRGSQYRDISSWVKALDDMLKYDVEYLLPGHTRAIIGKEKVTETLTNYRDAINFVLIETLKGMNEGKTADELLESVILPENLASLPYLQEYYGRVEWAVRSIFTGYLGWFDGNPTNLTHMKNKEKAQAMLDLIGGADKVITAIKTAISEEKEQWGMQLCDILLDAQVEVAQAKKLKGELCITLARLQTSANARHYYYVSSKQLLGTGDGGSLAGFKTDAGKSN